MHRCNGSVVHWGGGLIVRVILKFAPAFFTIS